MLPWKKSDIWGPSDLAGHHDDLGVWMGYFIQWAPHGEFGELDLSYLDSHHGKIGGWLDLLSS